MARLTGVESILLRNVHDRTSYVLPGGVLVECGAAIDSVSFAHLFWELADGQRLDTITPSGAQLANFQRWPQLVQTMKHMFALDQPSSTSTIRSGGVPQIEQIMSLPMFAIDMRELSQPFQRVYHRVHYSPDAEQLIDEVRVPLNCVHHLVIVVVVC